MDLELGDLLDRLRKLEDEFEQKVAEQRATFRYRMENGRAVFEEGVVAEHRRIKKHVLAFLRQSTFGALLISPFVYLLIIPFCLLDVSVWIYQRVCFTVWDIEPVRRCDYIVLDRHQLAYLNGIEKLNCLFCGYANGLVAYVREVASTTEQYWCPIKHAVRTKSAHPRYRSFADYGDADTFRARLKQFRDDVKSVPRET